MENDLNPIELKLTGAGWADIDLLLSSGSFRINSVSYLTDVLGDLVRIGLALQNKGTYIRWVLEHEPGETRVIFTRRDENTYNLAILEFSDTFDKKSDEEGRVVFEGFASTSQLLECIYSNATRILNRYGEEGYAKQWSTFDFPVENYKTLKAALRP